MSGERGTFVRVGLLIIAGFALLVGFVLFFGGNQFASGRRFETYFKESVQGLDVGAAVKYRGVTIGRVQKLGLVSAAYATAAPADLRNAIYRLVYVRFVVDEHLLGHVPNIEAAVAEGLRVRLAPQGITGLYYLELDFVDPKTYPPLAVPWKPEATYIPSVPSTLTQVQDAAQQLFAKLNKLDLPGLVGNVAGTVQDLRTEMQSGDVHRALAAVTRLADTATAQVKGADLAGVSAKLRQALGEAGDFVGGPQTRSLLATAGDAAKQLARLAARMPALISALQTVTTRANTTLAGIDAALAPALRDLRAAAASLRDTSAAFSRYPAGTLLGAPPPRDLGTGR